MKLKTPDYEVDDFSTADVEMKNGDHLSVGYTDPHGNRNVICIDAQHLVLIARHETTDKSIICRPSGVQVVD